MMRLITLTAKSNGNKILINPNKIIWVESDDDGSTVYLDSNCNGYFKESPDTIASLIGLATIDWSK